MKLFSNHFCCVVAILSMLLSGVSTVVRAQDQNSDTLEVTVDGKTLYCTYQKGNAITDYVLTLLNFDSVAQYSDFASAIAQEIYMNNKGLFHSRNEIRLIVDYKVEVDTTPVDTNLLATIEGVYFDFDKAIIKPDFYPVLDNIAEIVKGLSGDKVVTVCGYTDSKGSEEYNKELSLRRAKAVRSYLMKKGCDGSILRTKGYGSSHPVADNSTSEGRSKNRRCELRFNE